MPNLDEILILFLPLNILYVKIDNIVVFMTLTFNVTDLVPVEVSENQPL